MEKLSVRKCVVVSVGFYPGNARQALVRAGPVGGDVVFLVNSEPRTVSESVLRGGRKQPIEAMGVLRRFVNELDSGIGVVDVWLDPRAGIANNVAWLRSLVEGYAPCRVIIGMAGGFRWLSVALMFLALALSSVGRYVGVAVDSVFVMLEEESPSVRALFRNVEERVIPWPVTPRLADLSLDEYRVLRLIGLGKHRAKDIHGELNRDCKRPGGCVSMATVQRILVKLVKKGLINYEKRGKAHYYELKPLGLMLVGKVEIQRGES
ncbi:BlaI/MecI/CopY family transcriptional regulator [Vulcanisaeta distributa]|uniref:Transcriptional repressor, CopY family n=1 Tax=Vulcanisaeta distributa (strain DSM 14429 / JCM 11212 / NBRC 100878 / IC-017) TaxID=572478 RepID=E1QU75_VULDI|nr:BlaI/MecI/CopY family transcriptional regulator [Vulcanisaeta distributa]ADN51069.1 transcriptional repressor, CopY family [Vulcanisaeta distributa DSM 14429]